MAKSMQSQELLGRLQEDDLQQVLEVLHTKGEFTMLLAHLRSLKADYELQKGRLDVALGPAELHARYAELSGKVAAMEVVLTVLEARDV